MVLQINYQSTRNFKGRYIKKISKLLYIMNPNNAVWHTISVYVPKDLIVYTKTGKISIRPTLTKTMQVSTHNGKPSIKLVPTKSKDAELILGKQVLTDTELLRGSQKFYNEYEWNTITIKVPREMIVYTNKGKISLKPTLTNTLKLAKWNNQTSIKLLTNRPGTFTNRKFEDVQIHDTQSAPEAKNLKSLISEYVWNMNKDPYMYPSLSFIKSLTYKNIRIFDKEQQQKFDMLKTKREKGIFLRHLLYNIYRLYNPNSDEFFE